MLADFGPDDGGQQLTLPDEEFYAFGKFSRTATGDGRDQVRLTPVRQASGQLFAPIVRQARAGLDRFSF